MNPYDLVIIIILLTMLFFIRYLNVSKINKKENDSIECYEISEIDKNEIINYLKILTDYLDELNITYWIIGGTLLGSVRHGDIVPWDDDADIGIFEKDLPKILELNKIINQMGYEIVPHWKIYKFKKIGIQYPFVDIFLYSDNDNKYQMNDLELINKWPNEYYLHDELFPLKKYTFGNLYLSGPNYPIGYLNRMYPEWEYFSIQTFDHKQIKMVDNKIILDYSNPIHKLKPPLYIDNNISKNKNDNPYLRELFNLNHNKFVLIVK